MVCLLFYFFSFLSFPPIKRLFLFFSFCVWLLLSSFPPCASKSGWSIYLFPVCAGWPTIWLKVGDTILYSLSYYMCVYVGREGFGGRRVGGGGMQSISCKCEPHIHHEVKGTVVSVRTSCKMCMFFGHWWQVFGCLRVLTQVYDWLCVATQVLKEKITASGKQFVTVLLSEVFPDKLKLFQQVDAYVFSSLCLLYTVVCLRLFNYLPVIVRWSS